MCVENVLEIFVETALRQRDTILNSTTNLQSNYRYDASGERPDKLGPKLQELLHTAPPRIRPLVIIFDKIDELNKSRQGADIYRMLKCFNEMYQNTMPFEGMRNFSDNGNSFLKICFQRRHDKTRHEID